MSDDISSSDPLFLEGRVALLSSLCAMSLPFIPSCLPTTARLSGTDIILSQWIL